MVDEQLRVNLDAALANYDAVSFTRQSDGLVIEPHGSSQWSHIGFHPGEEVHVEAVRRAPEQTIVVKLVLDELEKMGVIPPQHYAGLSGDPDTLHTDADLLADPSQSHGISAVEAGLGLMSSSGQVVPTASAPEQPLEEYNAQGKKRRFCGACQNHNLKVPVTFQHQQNCQFRDCPCVACYKKRQISRAQANKRAMLRTGHYKSGSDMGDGNGSDSGTVDIINHVAEQDHQIHQLHQAARDHQQALLGQPAVDHQQHLMRHADMQHVGHEHEHLLVHEEQAHHDQQDPLGSLPLVHEQSVG